LKHTTNFIFENCFPLSVLRMFYLLSLFTTMSVSEIFWQEETPPRMSATKRQKTDPEITIKIQYLNSNSDQAFKKHVVLLQMITAMASHDIKDLNKKSKILKDSAILALYEDLIYKNHFNIYVKHANDKTADPKSVNVHKIHGIDTIQTLKKDPKVMKYLHNNGIHISTHNRKEEEWDLNVIGFLQTYSQHKCLLYIAPRLSEN
jgi:hypothetical protein